MPSNSKYQPVATEESFPVTTSHNTFRYKIMDNFCNKKFHYLVFGTFVLLTVYYVAFVSFKMDTDINTDDVQIFERVSHKSLGDVSKKELLKMLVQCKRHTLPDFESGIFATTEKKFVINSWPEDVPVSCRVPRLDPWDPAVKEFVEEPQALDCTDLYPLTFNSTFNSTVMPVASVETIESYGVRGPCCYQVVTREDKSKTSNIDNSYELSKACHPVSLESETIISPEHDHIAIKCEYTQLVKSENSSTEKMETSTKVIDMHSLIHLKPEVEERVKNITTARRLDGSGPPRDSLNVVILGIDGVSHMNFIRVMPLTYRYLMENLSAVEMQGVNKIGDNTFPNMGAALAGVSTTVNVTLTCETLDKTMDDCPMVWKKYAEHGYRTAYGEDATWMGIFNYLKKGFNTIPTDYYFRPFGRAAGDIIGTHKKLNAKECYGPRMQFDVVLNYLQKMAYTMGHDKRYFQLMWSTSLTHDYLNEGKLGDHSLLSTLEWFQDQGYLNNTMFILMSDHGIRHGGILDSPAGKLELRMPFLFFISPPWFKEKYSKAYENLKRNSHRLTTPFDLHQTLHDLVNLDILTNEALSKRETALSTAVTSGSVPRGISQFLPIPVSRTCSTAEVPEHYCICKQSTPLPVDNSTVLQAANYAVHYMNSLVSAHESCSYLSLAKVKSSQFVVESDSGNETAYQISFETVPGGGSFDASLFKSSEGFWQVSGTIGRTNLYGNQSHCVDDKELKLYCYCIDLI